MSGQRSTFGTSDSTSPAAQASPSLARVFLGGIQMVDMWFYSHGQVKSGPFTGQQLRNLADAGAIVRSDTIWKQGVEKGVLASKVKHLFAPVPVPVIVLQPLTPAVIPPAPPIESAVPPELHTVPKPLASAKPAANGWNAPRKGNAVAGKGAVLAGQDGVNVKYRKKCTTCNHLDSSWATMPIRSGVMRAGFFCPKCRKHREVEIHGSLH